jgi:hypothetical protein
MRRLASVWALLGSALLGCRNGSTNGAQAGGGGQHASRTTRRAAPAASSDAGKDSGTRAATGFAARRERSFSATPLLVPESRSA